MRLEYRRTTHRRRNRLEGAEAPVQNLRKFRKGGGYERAVFAGQIQGYRRNFEPSPHVRIGVIGVVFVRLRAREPGEHSGERRGGDKSP